MYFVDADNAQIKTTQNYGRTMNVIKRGYSKIMMKSSNACHELMGLATLSKHKI